MLRGPSCGNPRETVWSHPGNAKTPSVFHGLNDALRAAVSATGAVGECPCTASDSLQIGVFLDRTPTVVIVALVTYPADILLGSGTRLFRWPNLFRLTSTATLNHIVESSDIENFIFKSMRFSSLNLTKSFEANSIICCAHDENGRMSLQFLFNYLYYFWFPVICVSLIIVIIVPTDTFIASSGNTFATLFDISPLWPIQLISYPQRIVSRSKILSNWPLFSLCIYSDFARDMVGDSRSQSIQKALVHISPFQKLCESHQRYLVISREALPSKDIIYFHNASKMDMVSRLSRSCSSRFFSQYHRFVLVFLKLSCNGGLQLLFLNISSFNFDSSYLKYFYLDRCITCPSSTKWISRVFSGCLLAQAL